MARDARVGRSAECRCCRAIRRRYSSRARALGGHARDLLPLAARAGGESILLPRVARLDHTRDDALPRTGIDVTVSGGFVAERSRERRPEPAWTAFAHTGQPLSLSWKRKVDDRRAELPLRTRALVTTVVGLGEDLSQLTSAVAWKCQGRRARDSRYGARGLTVNQVEGATVGDWSVAGGLLRVRLLDPTATEASSSSAAKRARRARDASSPARAHAVGERRERRRRGGRRGRGEIADGRRAGSKLPTPASSATGHRTRVAVDGRLPSASARGRRTARARGHRRALHAQAVLIANVEEARYRALASEDGLVLVDGALRRAQQPAQLPQGDAAAGRHAVERQRGGPADPAGVAGGDAVLLPLEKGASAKRRQRSCWN
jgi:hypothetical protein